jgi:hypothetical protein
MTKTAASFLEESNYFLQLKMVVDNNIANDTLFQMCSSTCKDVAVQQLPLQLPANAPPIKSEPVSDAEFLDMNTVIDFPVENAALKKEMKCSFPDCDSSFSSAANLKRHEKLHTGEKPFVCPAEGCDKKFARKYDMKVHSRIHTKEKPYVCNICNKRFSRISSLREHERNLHQVDNSSKKRRFDGGEGKAEVGDETFAPVSNNTDFPKSALIIAPNMEIPAEANLSLFMEPTPLDFVAPLTAPDPLLVDGIAPTLDEFFRAFPGSPLDQK